MEKTLRQGGEGAEGGKKQGDKKYKKGNLKDKAEKRALRRKEKENKEKISMAAARRRGNRKGLNIRSWLQNAKGILLAP